jgi:TetR/AcrR family transcriptional regulator, tetracycline repressor protein
LNGVKLSTVPTGDSSPARQPRTPRGAGTPRAEALDRDRVVSTAIRLLDEVGLDGLSLRRLATELGVQAPALYWHVKNKEQLLELMVEAITAEEPLPPVPPDQPWDVALVEHLTRLRRTLNRHRDGAMLFAATRPTDNQWPQVEQILGVLVAQGLTPADGLRALIVAGNFVAGFTQDEQADRLRGRPGEEHSDLDWGEAMRALAPYPLMSAALREVGDPQGDASFHAGLELILDGLRRRIQDARAAPPPPPPPPPGPPARS